MTKFRFGARSLHGQHAGSPGRVHGIIPPNAGISHSAQERIDGLAAAAARRIGEAISIDSVPLYIFQPLKHGPLCNCGTQPVTNFQKEKPSNPYTIGFKVEDDSDMGGGPLKVKVHDVTAYDHHLDQSTKPNDPDHRFSEADSITDEPIPPPSSTSGTTNPYVDGSTSKGPYSGQVLDGLHRGSYDHEIPDSLEDEFGEELISEYESDPWDTNSILQDNAYVLGEMVNTCPICFGSGILGGYELLGGTRLVLSQVNATTEPLVGSDSSSQPPIYHLEPNDTVEWTNLNCPNYFTFAWAQAYSLRKKCVKELVITYTLNEVDWFPINQLANDSQSNLSTLHIKVANTSDNTLDFSHIDIALIHNEVRGNVSNFNQNAGRAASVKGDGLEISLPPEVGQIDRNSLIAETKYLLMWRVTTVSPISTARGQIVACSAQTELMEPSLVETVLFPGYNSQGNKQLIFGAGVEPVQGFR